MIRISGVVNTFNEAHNIRAALGSLLPWCDEVIVVDQHSPDGTADIAREMGARVFLHERTDWVEPARQFAVDQATGDWILILDADEIVPAPLARRLREIADADEPVDVVDIPNVNILLGRWARHANWWPGRKERFFRRGSLVLSPTIHAGILAAAGSRVLELEARKDLAIWHFSYHSVADLVGKADRYSTISATQRAAARTRHPNARRALKAGAGRLWREYIRGRGYRDGWVGLTVGLTRAYFVFVERVKQWDEPAVAARLASYDRAKSRLLEGYGGAGLPRVAREGTAGSGGSAPADPPQEAAEA
jgi:glycosyltransferase involved in cell wall biosynthesis